MNKEEVMDKLVNGMDKVAEWVQGAENMVMEHAPDIVQEIVVMGRAEHTAAVVVGFLLLSSLYFLIKTVVAKGRDEYGLNGMGMACVMTSIPVAILGMASICANFHNFLMSWLAPKLYVLEYIGNLF